MKNTERYTVITGASRGLGKSLAIECAKEGRNLILVSLPNENIAHTAYEISQTFDIKAVSYEINLTIDKDVDSLSAWIKSNFSIDMLINNAGMGGTDYFDEAHTDYLDTIIQLNMKALVQLTHKLLPALKKSSNSHILNISSLAAFGPMPYKTIYPASKAFVSSFSRGLNAELKKSNVSVSVAYPGGMATNPEVTKRMEEYSSFVQSTFLSPDKTAKILIKQTLQGKTIIVPGFANKINRLLFKFVPEELLLNMFTKSLQKELLLEAI
ncbi:MAG: SDR family NAD(P)-dependent oxidoreductase [Bacteroidota bacterium]